jgi:hypothetical protein
VWVPHDIALSCYWPRQDGSLLATLGAMTYLGVNRALRVGKSASVSGRSDQDAMKYHGSRLGFTIASMMPVLV